MATAAGRWATTAAPASRASDVARSARPSTSSSTAPRTGRRPEPAPDRSSGPPGPLPVAAAAPAGTFVLGVLDGPPLVHRPQGEVGHDPSPTAAVAAPSRPPTAAQVASRNITSPTPYPTIAPGPRRSRRDRRPASGPPPGGRSRAVRGRRGPRTGAAPGPRRPLDLIVHPPSLRRRVVWTTALTPPVGRRRGGIRRGRRAQWGHGPPSRRRRPRSRRRSRARPRCRRGRRVRAHRDGSRRLVTGHQPYLPPVGRDGLRHWQVAGGVLVDDRGVLLVQNLRRNGDLDWSTPGGVVDPGETAVEGLTREVVEETGLRVPAWQGPVYRVEVPGPGRRLLPRRRGPPGHSFTGSLAIDDPDGSSSGPSSSPSASRPPPRRGLAVGSPSPSLAHLIDGVDDGRVYRYRVDGGRGAAARGHPGGGDRWSDWPATAGRLGRGRPPPARAGAAGERHRTSRAPGRGHRPPRRHGRLLRVGRGPARPLAAWQAGGRRRHRQPGGGGRRLVRGPGHGVRSAMPSARARQLCPRPCSSPGTIGGTARSVAASWACSGT